MPRPTAITLAARGNAGAAEIVVDVHQADGERWWSIWPLPRDGSWTSIRATPDRFFQVDKQTASVLMDDGRNDVLPATSREAIASWVQAGGTLIAFPGTGCLDAAGGKQTLAGELGCRLVPGDYRVGRGRVIVLAEVPREPLGKAGKAVLAALDRAGCRPAVRVEPAANQALFRRGTRQHLVLHNKSPRLVGAWFDEIRIPGGRFHPARPAADRLPPPRRHRCPGTRDRPAPARQARTGARGPAANRVAGGRVRVEGGRMGT